jgi:ankyrin repeat protein
MPSFVHAHDDLPLQIAAGFGNTAAAVTLLNAGADVHVNNDSPLRRTVMNGHTETALALLKAGANLFACDEKTLTRALRAGHHETVSVIQAKLTAARPPGIDNSTNRFSPPRP